MIPARANTGWDGNQWKISRKRAHLNFQLPKSNSRQTAWLWFLSIPQLYIMSYYCVQPFPVKRMSRLQAQRNYPVILWKRVKSGKFTTCLSREKWISTQRASAPGSRTPLDLQGCTHSSGSSCWSGDRQQQGLSRRRQHGLVRNSGPYSCSFILFITIGWPGIRCPDHISGQTNEWRHLSSKAKHLCAPCQQVPPTWERCQQQNEAPHKSSWFLQEGTEGCPCNDRDIFCSGPRQELSNSFISCLCTKGSSIHWPEAWQGFRALT